MSGKERWPEKRVGRKIEVSRELAAMRNMATCELDKRRHLVTDDRNNWRHLTTE